MTTPVPFVDNDGANWALREGHVDSYRVPKIPSFFREDPRLWFPQVESSLAHANITTQKTMAETVIAALSFDEVVVIRDIISATPQPRDVHDQIKARIISSFSTSAAVCADSSKEKS